MKAKMVAHVGLLISFLAVPAWSTDLSFNASLDGSPSETGVLPQFNPQLGTLTSAGIEFSGSGDSIEEGGFAIFDPDTGMWTYFCNGNAGSATLSIGSTTVLTVPMGLISATCGSPGADLGLTAFSNFAGSGNAALPTTLFPELTGTGSFSFYITDGADDLGGTVAVTYSFDPVVPEPQSVALISFGVVLLWGASRIARRRRDNAFIRRADRS